MHEPNPVTRQNFIKGTGVVITSLVLGSLMQRLQTLIIDPSRPRITTLKTIEGNREIYDRNTTNRALTVGSDLIKAGLSKDKDQIIKAKKELIIWLFAETASKYGGLADYHISSGLLLHYLNGNGEAVDLSNEFKEISQYNPNFWKAILDNAFGAYRYQFSKPINSKRDFNKQYRQFFSNITNENGFEFQTNSIDLQDRTSIPGAGIELTNDLFYLVGIFASTLRAKNIKFNISETPSLINVSINLIRPSLTIYDKFHFHWQGDIQFKTIFRDFLLGYLEKNALIIEKLIDNLKLPPNINEKIKKEYSELKNNIALKLSSSDQSLIEGFDLVENDMNILVERLGATDFKTIGRVNCDSATYEDVWSK